ncbi:hypothetical protein RCZ15_06460 [Capnocytophaga catalasegens]|uniref:DUF4332 domain-containing protein n=2 Tax=Capnocytophaga catalasegens TaxID=1004260 RepID=A0AAV5AWG6_9FLAO|nr:hypothetical protein RCZ03_11560 [Capnocytophaga catalasegens]GJM49671.1 hypothetical protein RCZ15_06460 [Capnocytophaga catalasegens]GJM52736.1 hypothetical protein RCZ16_10530 [Capnocytophaga catalasegens]
MTPLEVSLNTLSKENEDLKLQLNSCQEENIKLSKLETKELEEELEVLRKKNLDLEVRLKKCQEAKNDISIESYTVPSQIQSLFDATLASQFLGKKIKENDLTIIEGIGPKIEELFKEKGIKTWKILSETSVETLSEILSEGGSRFQMHKPTTWPRQALLAYQGKWEELRNWQDTLKGGLE